MKFKMFSSVSIFIFLKITKYLLILDKIQITLKKDKDCEKISK